jgi:protein O-GlcNAc transferase
MSQLPIPQAFALALQQHQAGRLREAEQRYRQILAQQPEHADALHMLGVVAIQTGRNDAAVELIGKAVATRPGFPQALNNLANALLALGRAGEAAAACRQALALRAEYAEAWSNLGNALAAQKLFDEAIAAYRRAAALKPGYAEARGNLALALRSKGDAAATADEAVAAYREALALRPELAEVHYNLANVLADGGQLEEAIAEYRQAVAHRPTLAEGFGNLGNALRARGKIEEAIAAYRQAIGLREAFPEAHNNLGNALRDRGWTDEAVAAYRRAIALQPDLAEAHSNLGNALKDRGELDEALACYRGALAARPDFPAAASNLVYTMQFHPDVDASALADEHRRWNDRFAEPLRQAIRPHENDRDPHRRLRIGYVSPDFREHPVGRFLLPLLAHHDRRAAEVIAYAQVASPDGMTQRLRGHTGTWRNIVGLTDEQATEMIRRDRIDVLVDLTMHMDQNRLLVFARKPAPVQVTYLAYCASTGLAAMDYRLSDWLLDPPEMDESVYSEKTVRLDGCYWCYEAPVGAPEVGSLPAAAGGVTFGCFNNFCKITQPTWAAWAEILHQTPGSHLLLFAHEGSHRQHAQDMLEHDGIDPARLRFVGKVSLVDYLRGHHAIDIALDTFPYGGGTTTCDALWMGVPVVSLTGATAVGRGGLSILSALGLPELVARTPGEYVQIAGQLSADLPRLAKYRATLRGRMRQSPLMDAARFAASVEAAYRRMWRNWCGGG